MLHLHQQIDVLARHSLLVDPLLHDLWTESSAQSAASSTSRSLSRNSSSGTQRALEQEIAQKLDGVRTAANSASSVSSSKLALRDKLMGESCRDPQFKDKPLHLLWQKSTPRHSRVAARPDVLASSTISNKL